MKGPILSIRYNLTIRRIEGPKFFKSKRVGKRKFRGCYIQDNWGCDQMSRLVNVGRRNVEKDESTARLLDPGLDVL
jgi:hypothetical protein